jgi:SAM-dependent methyltransferase
MRKFDQALERLGVQIPKSANILDFGCGDGTNVYRLLDAGYTNVYGCDIKDFLKLRDPEDRSRFYIGDGRLPIENNMFDLVISDQVFEHVLDQVSVSIELNRITREGGHGLHSFPAKFQLVEKHIKVPLGGILGFRWWYKLWALLGVRNHWQKELNANEVADKNSLFYVSGLNYVSNSCYKVIWRNAKFSYEFAEQQFFDVHRRRSVRVIGKINRVFPLIGWLYRTFKSRHVYLRKIKDLEDDRSEANMEEFHSDGRSLE